MANVTREGRIRFELFTGEVLICGKCERKIEGTGITEYPTPESGCAHITDDGLETQDYIVLCSTCLESLAGPEYEAQEGEPKWQRR